MKKRITLLLIVSSIFSCSDELPTLPTNFVVEAYLTANQPINQIAIKETYGLDVLEDPNIPIENAAVTLTKNGIEYLLTYNFITKKYEYNQANLQVKSTDTFQLKVSVDGRIATSETTVPNATAGLTVSTSQILIPPITVRIGIQQELELLFGNARFVLNWKNNDASNYFIVVEKIIGSIPIFPSDFPIPTETLTLIQSFSVISRPLDGNSFEIPALSLESYGRYKATVYKINQEYVDLFDTQVLDSRDLIEAPSNINNALGIFTAIAGSEVFFEVVSN